MVNLKLLATVALIVPISITSAQTNPCAGIADDIVANPGRCSQYIACTNSVGKVTDCPTGTILRLEKKTCVAGNKDTCQFLDGLCAGRPDGYLIKHPNYCGWYISCKGGKTAVNQCTAGEIFRTDMQICVPGSVSTCSATGIDNMCDGGKNEVIYPHPSSCTKFVKCVTGNLNIISCPLYTVVQPGTIKCVPGNTGSCKLYVDQCTAGDGTYPHPDKCNYYIVCKSGAATVSRCDDGNIFRPEDATCVAGNKDTCEFLDGKCANQPDGYVIKHPNYCALFIWCKGGKTSVNPCPSNEILRPDMQWCVPGSLDSCAATDIDKMCEVVKDKESVVYPHPSSCAKYIKCENGNQDIISCPPYTVIQPGTIKCVPGNKGNCKLYVDFCTGPDGKYAHPDKCNYYIECKERVATVGKCDPGYIYRPRESACVAGNKDTCEYLDQVCANRPDNYVITHPNYCGMFIVCKKKKAIVNQCPPKEILRSDMQWCVPGSLESCSKTGIDTMCEGHDRVIYPHPDTCAKYVRCEQENLNIISCPPYTVIQPGTIQCVPGKRDSCKLYVDQCNGKPDGTYPHPDQCNLGIVCKEGTATVLECPTGTILRPEDGTCVAGNKDTCEFLDGKCANQPDGYVIKHPNYCGWYILCKGGKTSVNQCPKGEILRSDMQWCVPGKVEGCSKTGLDNMCDGGKDEVNYPHPDSCSKYVRCLKGNLDIISCPTNTIVEPGTINCVAGNKDSCTVFPVPKIIRLEV